MYCTESPQGQRPVFWDWGKGSYLHELSILIMQPKGLTPIQGIVACNNGVSQKQTKTIAKGDLEMLKCAAVHPRLLSLQVQTLSSSPIPASAWLLGIPCALATALWDRAFPLWTSSLASAPVICSSFEILIKSWSSRAFATD